MFQDEFQAQMNEEVNETSIEDQVMVQEILMDTQSNLSVVLGKINFQDPLTTDTKLSGK